MNYMVHLMQVVQCIAAKL